MTKERDNRERYTNLSWELVSPHPGSIQAEPGCQLPGSGLGVRACYSLSTLLSPQLPEGVFLTDLITSSLCLNPDGCLLLLG